MAEAELGGRRGIDKHKNTVAGWRLAKPYPAFCGAPFGRIHRARIHRRKTWGGSRGAEPSSARALKLAWAAARFWTALWAALLIVQGLIPVGAVYLTRPLVNRILAAIRSGGGWESVRPALATGALIAGLALLAELLRSATVWVRTHQSELMQDYIVELIQRKSAEVDMGFYDSADFYDRLHRARDEALYRPVTLLESLSGILQNSITLAAMLAVLMPFGAWIPLALAVSTLPALYVVLRNTVRQHEWRMRTTADERQTWYYDWLLTSYEAASELRLFALGGRFLAAYGALRERLRNEKFELAKSQALGEFAAGALALLAGSASLLWIAWRAVRGWITPGDLALFYQAFQQGLGLMRSLLENLGSSTTAVCSWETCSSFWGWS